MPPTTSLSPTAAASITVPSPSGAASPSASMTPTAPTTVSHLGGLNAAGLGLLVLGILVIVSVFVLFARGWTFKSANRGKFLQTSVIRSWLVLVLTGGLLLFVVAGFTIDDTTIRTTLVGALAANVGSAIAFYFASKSTAETVAALAANAAPAISVPDLTGKTVAEALTLLGSTALSLGVNAATPNATTNRVETQTPAALASVPSGSSIVVTLGSA
jgi:hypothetical protein